MDVLFGRCYFMAFMSIFHGLFLNNGLYIKQYQHSSGVLKIVGLKFVDLVNYGGGLSFSSVAGCVLSSLLKLVTTTDVSV